MCAGGAVWLYLQLCTGDLARQRLHIRHGSGSRARQAEVKHVDAQLFHQVEDADLLTDARVLHRRRLQAIAQRLVVE
jgi:hypothetical protein